MQWLSRFFKSAAKQDDTPILTGTSLKERYQIGHLIGKSDISTVWHATDSLFNRKLAVKVIDFGDAQIDDIQETFLLEVRAIAMMEHPHVVPIHDTGRLPNGLFITMPLATGGDLSDRIKADGMLPSEVISIAQSIGPALDYAHSEQNLHLNLKPTNILFDGTGNPYITDFGMRLVRQLLDKQDSPPRETLLYQAPEMLTGEALDSHADEYMVGILLFQMLTGHVPFSSESGLALAQIKDHETIPSVQTFREDLPAALDIVFQRLTHRSPEKRYPNAHEAVKELTEALSEHGKLPIQTFMSYSRQDKHYVYELAEKLTSAGIDLWIDRDIVMGQHWDNSIETALKQCEVMIVVLSKAAVASENVADEWSYFLEQGKTVLPLIYEECDIPFRLRRRQHIISTGNTLEDTTLIVKELHKTVSG